MIKVFGLKNCDTCRNAMKWLNNSDLTHEFHDLRDDGVGPDSIARWVRAVGWDSLLNRRSTTWRGLPEAKKADLNERSAMALMVENPTLIKPPVFEKGDDVMVGFKDQQKTALRAKH